MRSPNCDDQCVRLLGSKVEELDAFMTLEIFVSSVVKGDENHSFYCSRRFEALFDDQARTPGDTQRTRAFNAIQLLIHHDVPVIPLYYEDRLIGLSNRVTGFRLNMLWIPVAPETWDAR